jgi:hypothetical protein
MRDTGYFHGYLKGGAPILTLLPRHHELLLFFFNSSPLVETYTECLIPRVAAVVAGDEAVAEEGRWTYPTAQVVVKEVVEEVILVVATRAAEAEVNTAVVVMVVEEVEEVTTAVATKVEAEVTTAAVIEVVDVVALPHAAALARKSSSEFH